MSLLKRKTKTEYITPEFYKDWGNAAYELESLGRRLDATRHVIETMVQRGVPENHWALVQWRQNEAVILRKWKHTVRLKDTGLRQKQTWDSGPTISYDWWEEHDGIGGGLFPWMNVFDNWFNHSDLNHSWQKAMEEKLQKARQGLA